MANIWLIQPTLLQTRESLLKKKTRALTTFCSFDLFPTFAPLHYGVAFLSIIQGQRMDFARG